MSSLVARFRDRFGKTPRLFRAPGRINIIGEHVDYAGGLVMPAAIDRWCTVAISPNRRRTLEVIALSFDERRTIQLDAIAPQTDWSDYVAGVASVLAGNGIDIPGCDMMIDSEVPIGAGLSSSAALEVAVILALLKTAGVEADGVRVARWAQAAENDFVGMPCGIMDQFASANGKSGCAMLLDCANLSVDYIALPRDAAFLVVNSMGRHALVEGEYRSRRDAVETAGRTLGEGWLEMTDLPEQSGLPPPVAKRARHVVREMQRVRKAVAALKAGDLEELGSLMNLSHASLRDDMEVSTRELDALVGIAQKTSGVLGARMMGGGFGGSIIALVRADAASDARASIQHEYAAIIGKEPDAFVCRAVDGASEVPA